MRYAIAAAALAGVVAAHGGADSWGPPAGSWPASNGTDVYVTEVVTAFTTFCPVATQITHGGETYTVSSATTLTITNCPGGCTITKPVSTATPITSVASATPTAPKPTTPVAPGTAPAPKPSAGKPPGTAPIASGTAAPSGGAMATPTTSPIAPYKGAATQVSAGFAGLLAAVGLAALL